ncbi:MAG: patatin-like phospholipase family protein [Halarcobacter sp.]
MAKEQKNLKSKNITLTLSGGGIRTAASLGVIKYLEENNYSIKKISGTSGGAIIALLYAYGFTIKEIEEFFFTINKWDLFSFRFRFKSILSLNKIEKKLKDFIKDRELKIPIEICVTNIETGKAEYHSKNDLVKSTIASCSLLPYFPAVEIINKHYVDGGYSDNLPNKNLSKMKYPNISVNVNNLPKKFSYKKDVLHRRSLFILTQSAMRRAKKRADYFINIDSISEVRLFDFKSFDFVLQEGYKKVSEELKRY